jgi:hypothetical protein
MTRNRSLTVTLLASLSLLVAGCGKTEHADSSNSMAETTLVLKLKRKGLQLRRRASVLRCGNIRINT